MRLSLTLLAAVIPLLPLVLGGWARTRPAAAAGRLTHSGLRLAFGAALLAALLLGLSGGGPVAASADAATGSWLSLRVDVLSVVMAVLVTFLGVKVLGFSRTYLQGDPRQAAFLSWMSLTLGGVLVLVLAGSLTLLLVGWIAASLCLQRLLLHHPDRPAAVFAARKQFVISRAGDVLLLAAAILVHRHYGTTDFGVLFAAIEQGDTGPLPLLGLLLAGGALLHSAQFPFHSWLPDTMETPTPVSALMHAGVINAGGFLILRLHPVFAHAPTALTLLALVGLVTAAFGAIVMLPQPGVKRSLAYSTIAQMGFLFLQCGLGATGLALIHLVAHALYKARAFLHAGSTVGTLPRAAVPLRPRALLGGLVGAGLLVAGLSYAFAQLGAAGNAPWVFLLILAFALAYGLSRAWSAHRSARTIGWSLAAGAGLGVAALAWHAVGLAALPALPAPSPALTTLVASGFALLFTFQALLWRAGGHEWGRRLYVHALNGFYIGTTANRLLGRLWPRFSA